MTRLLLIAASDDYLLEERLREEVARLSSELGGVSPEPLPEAITPEDLAVEIRSPSLFDPQRLFVLPDVRPWLDAPAPPDAPKSREKVDVSPLVRTLEEGVPDGVGVVLGAWCARKPKGELAAAIEGAGSSEWISLPPPPKPWETVSVSSEQRAILKRVIGAAAGTAALTPQAEDLLLERLGFAPRLLAQEVEKLAAAAGDAKSVDEDLVRRLVFPRERSLEVVRDAVLARDGATILDLVAAASEDRTVLDWQGQRMEPFRVKVVLFGQIFNLLQQMLYIRRICSAELAAEMEPSRTAHRGWYGKHFKSRIGPELEALVKAGGPSPLHKAKKLPTMWSLGHLFAAAGRYPDQVLIGALAGAGEVEAGLRSQSSGFEALSAWLVFFLADEGTSATR